MRCPMTIIEHPPPPPPPFYKLRRLSHDGIMNDRLITTGL